MGADPAVNNKTTKNVSDDWACRCAERVRYVELSDLPTNHDIIDPENALARTDLVYPKLLEALGV